MISDKPHVSIIILNWNGWKDTIECLESVLKLNYPNFNIILIDNNSTDDSIAKIQFWADGKSNSQITSNYPDLINPSERKPINIVNIDGSESNNIENTEIGNRSILFVKNTENFGFAIANNQGMDFANDIFESDYYYLLNNDTVIEKNALTDLVNIFTKDKSISVAQSTLYSYEQGKIVNAGGKILFWGQTKYYKRIKKNEVREVSSVSGCALFVRSITIKEFGQLSDKFFHGEEDFEFSLRMKEYQQIMVCSEGSRVYHKIGMSVKKMMIDYERRTFLFALNRIIDLKDYYPKIVWSVWRVLALLYFGYLLKIQYKVSMKRTLLLIGKIYNYSSRLKDVKKVTMDRVYSEMKFL